MKQTQQNFHLNCVRKSSFKITGALAIANCLITFYMMNKVVNCCHTSFTQTSLLILKCLQLKLVMEGSFEVAKDWNNLLVSQKQPPTLFALQKPIIPNFKKLLYCKMNWMYYYSVLLNILHSVVSVSSDIQYAVDILQSPWYLF